VCKIGLKHSQQHQLCQKMSVGAIYEYMQFDTIRFGSDLKKCVIITYSLICIEFPDFMSGLDASFNREKLKTTLVLMAYSLSLCQPAG